MKQVRTTAAVAIAVAGVLLAGSAEAAPAKAATRKAAAPQMVTGDVQSVMAALQENNMKPRLSTEANGDPEITAMTGAKQFVVVFEDCTEHRNCTSVELQTGWSSGTKEDLAAINAWNMKAMFARAYLDNNGNRGVVMDIPLNRGGEPAVRFRDWLVGWAALVENFRTDVIHEK
jgi:hypothetical protein